MGDLKVGDYVITPEGKSSKVSGIFPQGMKEIYEIKFRDGAKTKTCLEHLWKIYGIPKGKNRIKNWATLSTNELLIRIANNTSYKLKIPLVNETINTFNKKPDFFIDPYILGALIGDGNLHGNQLRFTSTDEEIIQKVNLLLNQKGYFLKRQKESIS